MANLPIINICDYSKIEDLPEITRVHYKNRIRNSSSGIEFYSGTNNKWYSVHKFCKDKWSILGISFNEVYSEPNKDMNSPHIRIYNYNQIEDLPQLIRDNYKGRIRNSEDKTHIEVQCSYDKNWYSVHKFRKSKSEILGILLCGINKAENTLNRKPRKNVDYNKCLLYLLKFNDRIKIGITNQFDNRKTNLEEILGKCEIINIFNSNRIECEKIEKKILNEFKEHRFKDGNFAGYSECFPIELKENIQNILLNNIRDDRTRTDMDFSEGF